MSETDNDSKYTAALARGVDQFVDEFKKGTASPFNCGFARIGGLDGRTTFVKWFKDVAEADPRNGEYYRHPEFPLTLSKNDYEGGYDLSYTNLRGISNGPEFQDVSKVSRGYRALLAQLESVGVNGEVRSRLD